MDKVYSKFKVQTVHQQIYGWNASVKALEKLVNRLTPTVAIWVQL